MAESSSGEGKAWWDGWIQVAKDKTSQTLELIKHDLQEFSQVCSQDASQLMTSTTDAVQQSLQGGDSNDPSSAASGVKAGLANLLGGLSKVLTIPPDDEEEDDVPLVVTSSGGFKVFDKAKARLFDIQVSMTTYCNEPDGLPEQFKAWQSTFNLENRKGEISELLVSVNEMRGIYTKLVPSAVSHNDFWERYFYKVFQLEQDEKRKQELKSRADKLKNEQEAVWEDDWGASELSPTNGTDVNVTVSSDTDKNSSTTADTLTIDAQDEQERIIPNTQNEKSSEISPIAPCGNDGEHNNDTEGEISTVHEPSQAATGADELSIPDVKVQEKGGYVMIGSDRPTPTSSIGSNCKETSSLDDDWDKEFESGDLDMQAVKEITKKLEADGNQDDIDTWDPWE